MQLEIIKFIQSIISPFWDAFFQIVTMTGEEYFYIIAAAIVFWCVSKDYGYKLGFAILTSTLINSALKDIINTTRPIGEAGVRSLRLHTANGQSFPSGHTQGATTFWFSAIIQIKKKWIYVVGITMIFLVGLSRLYLGLHYPIDVIGGIVVGIIWTLISNYIFDYARSTNKNWILMIIIIPMFASMIFFRGKTYYTIAGTVLGFVIGYILETKYVQFEVRSPIKLQLIKLAFGLAILIAIKNILKQVLPISIYYDFFRYFVVGLWITVGAPSIFKKFIRI